jgi:hypothetical protein
MSFRCDFRAMARTAPAAGPVAGISGSALTLGGLLLLSAP